MQGNDAHYHLSSGNIIQFDGLERLFAANDDIVGARYKELLEELAAITEHQWRSGATRGLD